MIERKKEARIYHETYTLPRLREVHLGRKRSKETRTKQSEAKRRYFETHGSDKISGKGKKYISNEVTKEIKRVDASAPIPEGWKSGLPKKI